MTHEPTHSDEKTNNQQHLRYASMYTQFADVTVVNGAPLIQITRYFSCVFFLLSHTVLILYRD